MLKRERLLRIVEMVNAKGILTVNDIMEALPVSDMTIRRDLDELEKNGKLLRVHGGAQSLTYKLDQELSHLDKSSVQMDEKKAIAMEAAALIKEEDTVFLGPGTTLETLAQLIAGRNIRVVTNSMPVFRQISENSQTQVILVGGNYRDKTGTFIGPLANEVMSQLKCRLAFISCNGISNEQITVSSLAEGEIQKIALNNAQYRYVLADHTKLNQSDFFVFYELYNVDALIIDAGTEPAVAKHYEEYTKVIQAKKEDAA